jgi:hypothetical protein
VNKWEEEEMGRKKLLHNICEYNYILEHPNSTNAVSTQSQSNYNSGPPDFIVSAIFHNK